MSGEQACNGRGVIVTRFKKSQRYGRGTRQNDGMEGRARGGRARGGAGVVTLGSSSSTEPQSTIK